MMANSPQDAIRGQVGNMSMPSLQQVYSQTLNLVLGTAINLDFKSLVNQNKLENIQGIFADNSAGTSILEITAIATNTTFKIPPGYQGVMPLYMTADMALNISGAGTVPVTFLNFPTPAAVWPATAGSSSNTYTGDDLNTRDSNIAAHTVAGGIQTMQRVLGGGDAPKYLRQGSAFHGTLTANGTTTIVTGAPTFFLTSARVYVSGNAAFTAPTNLVVTLAGSVSGTIAAASLYGVATVPLVTTVGYTMIDISGVDFVGSASGENLTLTVAGANFASGLIDYTIGAGTTADI
jgi:hypothetical protein